MHAATVLVRSPTTVLVAIVVDLRGVRRSGGDHARNFGEDNE
jgi:hypothetical protein